MLYLFLYVLIGFILGCLNAKFSFLKLQEDEKGLAFFFLILVWPLLIMLLLTFGLIVILAKLANKIQSTNKE